MLKHEPWGNLMTAEQAKNTTKALCKLENEIGIEGLLAEFVIGEDLLEAAGNTVGRKLLTLGGVTYGAILHPELQLVVQYLAADLVSQVVHEEYTENLKEALEMVEDVPAATLAIELGDNAFNTILGFASKGQVH